MPDRWNQISRAVIGAAIDVHNSLGPGLLENLYEEAMAHELLLRRIPFRRQQPIRLHYKGVEIGDLRLDLVVDDLIVVELKAVERTAEVHRAQALSYLRSTDLPLGLLINFNHPRLVDGVSRILNVLCPAFLALPATPPLPSACSDPSVFPPEEE
ncbi:MAG: GxxExxY protein [Phycisphaeraceae bacterium]|nr:GxxExxY protein [Phycisphaeraceae bacterium]